MSKSAKPIPDIQAQERSSRPKRSRRLPSSPPVDWSPGASVGPRNFSALGSLLSTKGSYAAPGSCVLPRSDVSEAVAVRKGRDHIGRQGTAVAVAPGQPADQGAEARVIGSAGIDERAVNLIGLADDGPVHPWIVLRLPVVYRADDGQPVGLRASEGISSEMRMPGTLVAMGLKGPRTASGRIGLHVPKIEVARGRGLKIRMTDRARAPLRPRALLSLPQPVLPE